MPSTETPAKLRQAFPCVCPFDRPATIAERVFLTARGALSDPTTEPRLLTRVEVRGVVRRRTWPMLGGGL